MAQALFQVKSSTVEDYETFLELLFKLGYTFSCYSNVKAVNEAFGVFAYPTVVFREGSKNPGGNINFHPRCGTQYTLPQDFSAVFNQLNHPEKYSVVVKNVGDYEAMVTKNSVQVGCQTISFEKFEEIAEAVKQIRK